MDANQGINITALISAAVSAIVGIALVALRYAIGQRDKDVDRRLSGQETTAKETETDQKAIAERLRLEELKSVAMAGDIKVIQNNHSGLDQEMRDLRENIVTRGEWEARMTSLEARMTGIERMLQQILSQLQPPSRYSQHSQHSQQGRYGGPTSDPSFQSPGDKTPR